MASVAKDERATPSLAQLGDSREVEDSPPAVAMNVDGDEDDEDVKSDEDAAERTIKPLPSKAGGSKEDAEDEDDDEEEEEEEEEDEEEEEEEDSRPRKKKRKRRGANQFLDVEAEVDEDEEDDEEAEEGWAAQDDFIVGTGDRESRRAGLAGDPSLFDDDDEDVGSRGDDASHRRLDRKLNKAYEAEAAEIAEGFKERYKQTKYSGEGQTDEPSALFLPGVEDPSLWGVRCKQGKERDLIFNISRKAAAMARADSGPQMGITSAFYRESIKGIIYVESRTEVAVREAVNGLVNIYANGKNGVFLVDIEEMPDLLKTKQKRVEPVPGSWVRIKRGKYAGDLAQIMSVLENGEELTLKFVPRVDLTPRDDGTYVGPDGKKRKKSTGAAIGFKPPQRWFDPDEIKKVFGPKAVQRKPDGYLHFKGDDFKDGFIEKDVKTTGVELSNVNPTIDELTKFLGGENEHAADTGSLDLKAVQEAAKASTYATFQPGDMVIVHEGDQKGTVGMIDSITADDVITIVPEREFELGDMKLEFPARALRKRFKIGDHIKVFQGMNANETGLVTLVDNETVTFIGDLSQEEFKVFSKDIRISAEAGSSENVVSGYELHDLVSLVGGDVGVIFKIEAHLFLILDQTGRVRRLQPSQVVAKEDKRDRLCLDKDGSEIKPQDLMKEIQAGVGGGKEREGRVLSTFRGAFVFLHNRDYQENGGVFVMNNRHLRSPAPKASKPQGWGNGPPPPQQSNAYGRRDGRLDRRIKVTKGPHKGKHGMIKEVTGLMARIELYSDAKVISVPLEILKEVLADGEAIELVERPRRDGQNGGLAGFGGGGSFRGASTSNSNWDTNSRAGSFSREPSFAPSVQSAAGGALGKTPAWNPGMASGMGNGNGGKTPAWGSLGGKTPAWSNNGDDNDDDEWGAAPTTSGSSAWNASSKTPAYQSSSSAWNPSSKTPFHPGAGGSSSSSAWNASSKTPAYLGGGAGRLGGATPMYGAKAFGGGSFGARGGATPMYGAKAAGAGAGGATPMYGASGAAGGGKTPLHGGPSTGGSTGGWDSWSGKTPAAGAPTPYGSAPTPTAYGSAPTPAAGAPTPAGGSWDSAPTPAGNGAYWDGPTPRGGPTPGGALSAPTPGIGGYGQTPGLSAPTPNPVTAPTPAAGGWGGADQPRQAGAVRIPTEWALVGAKVRLRPKSGFQGGAYDSQSAVVIEAEEGTVNIKMDSDGTVLSDLTNSMIEPLRPTEGNQFVVIIGANRRGRRAKTIMRDGNDWLVNVAGDGQQAQQVEVDQSALCLAVQQ